MAHTDVTQQTFKQEVLDVKGKVLVDFWAPWCGPCQMLGPVLEEIGEDLGDKVKVVKINVDEENTLASQYNVSAIPTVILFEDGQPKETFVGFRQKQDYIDAVTA
jgi:thioredoxin 1